MYNLRTLPSTEYKVVPSVADGDCLFFALSIGLYGNSNHTQLLRKQTTDHILQNIDHFRPFLNASAFFKNSLCQLHLDPFRNYILNLRQDGIWAGVESIAAISDLYNIKVQLHQAFKTTPRVYEPSKSSESVKLPVVDLFYDGEFHYQPITPCHRQQDAIVKSPSEPSSSTHTRREPILSSFEPFIQSQVQKEITEPVFNPDVPVQRKREPILSSIEPFIENRTHREISGPVFKPNVSSCTKREPILSSFEPFIQSQVQQKIAEPVFKPDVPDQRKRGPILSSSEELIPYPSQQETTKHTSKPIIASSTKREPILSSFEYVIPYQSQEERTNPTFRPAAPILAKREPILSSFEPFTPSQSQPEPLICGSIPDSGVSCDIQQICAQSVCDSHVPKRLKQESTKQTVKSSVLDFQSLPMSEPTISSATQQEPLFASVPLKTPLLSTPVISSLATQDPVLTTLNKSCHSNQEQSTVESTNPLLPQRELSVLTDSDSSSKTSEANNNALMSDTKTPPASMLINSNPVYGDGSKTFSSIYVGGFVEELKHDLLTHFSSEIGLDFIAIQDISLKIPSEMIMENYKLFAPMHGTHVDDDSRCGFLVANNLLPSIIRVISPTPSIIALFINFQNRSPCCCINVYKKPKDNPDSNTEDSIYDHLDVIIKEANNRKMAIIVLGCFNCKIGRNDAEKWTAIDENALFHEESDAAGLLLADYMNKCNLNIVTLHHHRRQCYTRKDGTEHSQTDYCFHSSRMHIAKVFVRTMPIMLSSHKLLNLRCFPVLYANKRQGLLPEPSLLGVPTPSTYINTKRIDRMIAQNISRAQKRQRPSDN